MKKIMVYLICSLIFTTVYAQTDNISTFENAFNMHMQKARDGNSNSMHKLGLRYIRGEGVKANIQKAIYWLEKASKYGNSDADYDLFILYVDGGNGVSKDVKKSLTYLQRAAKHEQPQAQLVLSVMYYRGVNYPKDVKKAIMWLKRSAENENMKSMRMLANMYFSGEHVEQDVERGIALLKKVVTKSYYKEPQYYADVVKMLRDNKRYSDVIDIYQALANDGSDKEMLILAKEYESGEIVSVDYNKAIKWYSEAAKKDNAEANYLLARIFASGNSEKATQPLPYGLALADGIEERYNILHIHMKQARKLNLPDDLAHYNELLLLMKANILMRAEQGNVYAQYYLGCLYNDLYLIRGEFPQYKSFRDDSIKWLKLALGGKIDDSYMISDGKELVNKLFIDRFLDNKEYRKAYRLNAYHAGLYIGSDTKEMKEILSHVDDEFIEKIDREIEGCINQTGPCGYY